MAVGFGIVSCLVAIGLVSGIIYLYKKEDPDRRLISRLMVSAIFAVLGNGLAVNMQTEWAASFFYMLYFVAADWLVFLLIYFTVKNAEYEGRKKNKLALYAFCCGLDTVSMAANFIRHHVFICKEQVMNGRVVYCPEFQVQNAAFFLHILLRASLIAVLFYTYSAMMVRTVKLYRGRYRNLIGCILGFIIFNSACHHFFDFPDFGSLLYALLVVECVYFSRFYVSRKIVAKVLSLLTEDVQTGLICFDRLGKCIQVNDAFRNMFGKEMQWDSYEEYFSSWRMSRHNGELKEEFWREEHEIDGETRYFDAHFNILQDENGSYVGSFFSFADRTESVLEYEQKRYEATHDELTDVYNRKRFFEEVEKKLKEETDIAHVMVCIDVKDFSVVNDLFGEKTGNQILQRIAGLMRRDASETTVYGRLESDHFAMFMHEESFDEASYTEYLEDLKRIVHSSVYQMHVHVGVYRIIDPSISISVMCDRAFAAIMSIKDSYQHIVAYYTESMGHTEQREKVMIGEFDRALAAGEFQMFLQPQISVGDYRVLGAEALVRWDHPVRGMISPGVFIPVFEKSGQITRLDNYMWELACRQLRAWKDQGIEDLHISVNISPKDFYLVDIYNTFTSLVELYGIDPANLKLEITETALMEEISKQFSLLEKLRKYGFQVEIDDFGSGYSSLNTLQDIEVDVLKLDMGFLHKTSHGRRSKIIMNSVISMSRDLGLTVVTEGVETQAQVDYLTWAGCDIFQGYYFSKPIPVREFEAKYLESRKGI